MLKTSKLIQHCNDLLNIYDITDYCPNGLQIQGNKKITKIVSGVTASLALIEKAVDEKADALLVHHGYFWKNEPPEITKIKYSRIKLLMDNNINLIVYHLPLDMHETLGNNVQLARVLGVENARCIQQGKAKGLFWYGNFSSPVPVDALAELIEQKLLRKPLVIAGHDQPIKKIGWCTGAAQDMIRYAIDRGLDAFISGEVSEHIYHLAKEARIVYFAAGHHATERYGVQALGEYIANKLDVEHVFFDEDNPV